MTAPFTALELEALAQEFIDGIVATIESAPEELLELAADLAPAWYPYANSLAVGAANLTDVQNSGIISALSVMTRWSLNERDFHKFHRGEVTPYLYKVRRSKADRIAALDNPTIEEVQSILGPYKTGAFANNILYPKTSDRVTLDTIMCQAGGIDQTILTRKGVYARLEQAARDLAESYGWERANEFQAYVWIIYRGEAW